MPKLIVLAFGSDASSLAAAEAAAEGAKGVRFTEVDLRNGDAEGSTGQPGAKRLESASQLADYDGVLISCGAGTSASSSATALLDDLAAITPESAFTNTVFGLANANASLIGRLAQLGGIILAEPRGIEDATERAKALGARMAKVIEWVRHAQSHETKDHTHHHH